MSDTSPAGEARSVERSRILVDEGFNPRSELGGLEQLASSVARHGILQPLLVRAGEDGSLVLVDGHRRLAAAAQAGLEQLPVLVRRDLDGRALVAAMVTALKREDLNVVEEAKAYGRLIDGGLTKKGAAEAVGAPQKTVTVRLQILELPEQLHAAIATGQIALSSIPALVAMAKVSPKLAELVGPSARTASTPGRPSEPSQPSRASTASGPPAASTSSASSSTQSSAKQVQARSDQWSAWRPRFDEDELDRARAAGVLYTEDDDGYGYRSTVICDTELVRELTIAALQRDVTQRQRRLSETRETAGKPEPGSAEGERIRAERKAVREQERELAVRARGANLDLGRKLLDQLAELEFSKDLAELLAYTILSRPVEGYWTEQAAGGAYSVAQLAGRGLRYVLADWQDEQQLKNGTTKVTYTGQGKQADGRAELEERFWAWFEAAKTAEQIAGRLVIALAAAHWALDECVPRSQRTSFHIYRGKNDRALKALERLTRKATPASIKRLRTELNNAA